MQERTIDNALLALRKQLTQERGEGIEHVEALLYLRGVRMPPVQSKRNAKMPRNTLGRAVLAILKDGPMTWAEIAARLQDEGMQPGWAKRRASNGLAKLRRQGLIERCDGGWGIREKLFVSSDQPI